MANIKKIREVLTKAIFEVFEKIFFVFSEPVAERGEGYKLLAHIRFDGPMQGTIQLSMKEDLAKIMAKNIMDLDDSQITEEVLADCMKECINMICGGFVRKIDPDHVFQLTIPRYERIKDRSKGSMAESESTLKLFFDSEGGGFEVAIQAPGCLEA